MQKTMLIIIIVCFTIALTNVAIAGGYQSRFGFGTGNFRAPDPLGLNNGDPLGLGNAYKYSYNEGRSERPRLYDATGQALGFINPDNGYVFSNQGEIMFRIDSNQDVYSKAGQHLGRMDEDGKLYRRDGLYMGRIQ